jgi:hypothetical protein
MLRIIYANRYFRYLKFVRYNVYRFLAAAMFVNINVSNMHRNVISLHLSIISDHIKVHVPGSSGS